MNVQILHKRWLQMRMVQMQNFVVWLKVSVTKNYIQKWNHIVLKDVVHEKPVKIQLNFVN